jgi:hypothetical protein
MDILRFQPVVGVVIDGSECSGKGVFYGQYLLSDQNHQITTLDGMLLLGL